MFPAINFPPFLSEQLENRFPPGTFSLFLLHYHFSENNAPLGLLFNRRQKIANFTYLELF